jgi:hypothetical protein
MAPVRHLARMANEPQAQTEFDAGAITLGEDLARRKQLTVHRRARILRRPRRGSFVCRILPTVFLGFSLAKLPPWKTSVTPRALSDHAHEIAVFAASARS